MIIPEIKMSEAKKGKSFEYYLNKCKCYHIIAINTSSLFNGNIDMIRKARKKYPSKPILRKDFIIIPRQIDESKEAGADLVLLLSEYLTEKQLDILINYCKKKDIKPVIETNSYISCRYNDIVLVNSRNLNTGKISKQNAINLCKYYSKAGSRTVIYASGEKSDIITNIDNYVLIGTAFMKEKLK